MDLAPADAVGSRSNERHGLARALPILHWARRYDRGDLPADAAAGLTVAAMLVPQAMAYALLAGLPPEVGLYAATLPLLAYAIFGTSRQLAVGPVAIVSLLTASALGGVAAQGSVEYVKAAAALALMVGLLNVALGLVRLGWVVNLLSHPVLVGFTGAAALIIGLSQVKHLLGVSADGERFFPLLGDIAGELASIHWLTAAISAGTIALLVALKRWRPRVPGALVVVVLGIAASAAFGLQDHGVKVVDEIPGSLPGLALPDLGGGLAGDLAPAALAIVIVGYMESIAVAKVYARRNRYDVEPNQEFVGLGAANVTAGLFGGYPVTGGLSRTAVNASAGARTPLASIVTAGVVVLAVLLVTPLFEWLPKAVLAAIVVVAVANLFDVEAARHIAHTKRSDLASLIVAFVATLALGVEIGIAVAIGFSIALLVSRVMRPHTAELGRLPGTHSYRNVERFPDAERFPGLGLLRIDVSLNFLNATFLKNRLRQLEAEHPEGLRWVVLDGSGINDLDVTGVEALSEMLDELEERGVEIHLADMKGPVRDVLLRSGLWERVGDRVHVDVAHAAGAVLTGASAPVDRRLVGIDERG